MRIGLSLGAIHPHRVNEQMVALAESIGADSAWAVDHMLGTNHPALYPETGMAQFMPDPDAFLDPWIVLAALAGRTSLPLGLCVTDALRRGAGDVARAALSLQHLIPGGFHLGIGAGERENLEPYGQSFERPVARTEAFLEELRSLLDTGRSRRHGGRLGVPLQSGAGRCKVWVAGHGPRMLRLTGTFGDGWLPAWTMTPTEFATRLATINDHAAQASRPPVETSMLISVLLAPSREAAAEAFEREPLAKLFALIASADQWERHGLEHPEGPGSRGLVDLVVHDLDPDGLRDIAPRIPFALLEEVLFIGSVDEVVDRIAPYHRVGLDRTILANMTGIVGGAAEVRANARPFKAMCDRLLDL